MNEELPVKDCAMCKFRAVCGLANLIHPLPPAKCQSFEKKETHE